MLTRRVCGDRVVVIHNTGVDLPATYLYTGFPEGDVWENKRRRRVPDPLPLRPTTPYTRITINSLNVGPAL